MAQSVIDKLMELKKLYEAGILTKEELEEEKQKVLGKTEDAQLNEIVVQESVSVPSTTTEKDNKKGLWIGLGTAVLVLIVIICVIVSNNKNTVDDYVYDNVVTDTTSCVYIYEESLDAYDDGIAEVIDIEDDDNLYEIDEWVGTYAIRGCYRLCDSEAILRLKRTDGDSYYIGTMFLMLGSEESDGKFNDYQVTMYANVYAKQQGDQLVVVLDDFTMGDEVFQDLFGSFRQGQQIFCITNSYGNYSVRPLEEMKNFFDGQGCDNKIYKQW